MRSYKLDFRGKKVDVTIEKYVELKKMDVELQKKLESEINLLLINCWGIFPQDFIKKHIFSATGIFVARIKGSLVGISVISIKTLMNVNFHYMEFLLVNNEFQNSRLGSLLTFSALKSEIIKNIFSILLGKPLEIFFITPNIRVLGHAARFASFIYPNPYLANEDGIIQPADEQTWNFANEILRNSDNPQRELLRDGLVLVGSYVNTPWLVYNNDNAPWHNNDKVNLFARKYLGYHNGLDREFIVRAHFNFSSIARYVFYL